MTGTLLGQPRRGNWLYGNYIWQGMAFPHAHSHWWDSNDLTCCWGLNCQLKLLPINYRTRLAGYVLYRSDSFLPSFLFNKLLNAATDHNNEGQNIHPHHSTWNWALVPMFITCVLDKREHDTWWVMGEYLSVTRNNFTHRTLLFLWKCIITATNYYRSNIIRASEMSILKVKSPDNCY